MANDMSFHELVHGDKVLVRYPFSGSASGYEGLSVVVHGLLFADIAYGKVTSKPNPKTELQEGDKIFFKPENLVTNDR